MLPCQPGISPPKASVANDGCPFLGPSRGEITAGRAGGGLSCELCSSDGADTGAEELASDDAGKVTGDVGAGLGDGGRWSGGACVWDGSDVGGGGEALRSRTKDFG